MFAAWYKKQMVKEAEEKGHPTERMAWQDWRREHGGMGRRKAEAERDGRLFDEPEPASPDADQVDPV